MPTAAWRGSVTFGLVSIPVRMYRAAETGGASFRMLCADCHTPIQNRRWCPNENKIIEWSHVLRGFELEKDEFVEITDADLERLPLPTAREVEILDVVDDGEVDQSLYLNQAYFLEPEKSGARAYSLLRQALKKTRRSAIGKIAVHQREHLCRISAREEVLMLNTLHWADEVMLPSELKLPEAAAEVGKRELSLAISLLDNMQAKFDPSRYRDDYAEALEKLVQAKQSRRRLPKPKRAPAPDNVVDLMSALKAAVSETGRSGRRASERRPTSRPAKPAATRTRRRAS